MIYGSLDSSHQDASNGNKFMSLALIVSKLFATYYFESFVNNSSSINPRGMILLSLDASWWDESNEP